MTNIRPIFAWSLSNTSQPGTWYQYGSLRGKDFHIFFRVDGVNLES